MEALDMKPVTYSDGVPRITWMGKESSMMNIKEDLQFVVIEKSSLSDLKGHKEQIPKKCNVKAECKIGLFRN